MLRNTLNRFNNFIIVLKELRHHCLVQWAVELGNAFNQNIFVINLVLTTVNLLGTGMYHYNHIEDLILTIF